MDVYISEEYIISRRREKKAAADARRRSEVMPPLFGTLEKENGKSLSSSSSSSFKIEQFFAVSLHENVKAPGKDIKLQDINLSYMDRTIKLLLQPFCIKLEDINLSYMDRTTKLLLQPFCFNGYRSVLGGGIINPHSCFKTLPPPSALRIRIIKPPTFLMDFPFLIDDF